ncbi:MAG TPA: outer membrane beta-barrel protein, partial [Puia sp.]
MTKNLLLLLITGLFFTTPSFSQTKPTKGTVKGLVVDSADNKQPLSNATISVLGVGADSTEAEFVVSDKKGAFLVRNLKPAAYRLVVSFEGYQPVMKTFNISDANMNVDLSTLYMVHADKLLAEVVVQRPPMGIKKDTVEYNAGMFAVKPNAVAEDLLRKMPGVQVDKNGNITAQGETVTRVLVDGKRFFSDDPKLATRNLPPDVIDRIQVFDDLSDQSKFSGFDDGNRVKTINIVTKRNTRKGYFGKLVAGAGTNENYDESINIHRFDGDQQISVLGQANDVNKQNFSPQDIFGNGGGRGGGGGGRGGGGGGGGGAAFSGGQSSTGVTSIWAGGANYRNAFGPKTDFYGSYFYNNTHVSTNSADSSITPISKEGAPTDSANIKHGNSSSISRTENHRVFLNLEQRFDSNNSLIFRPNITFQHSNPNGYSSSQTIDNIHGQPINTSVGRTSSENSGFAINSTNLQFRHRFKKPFRTISLDVNTTANINNGTGYNYSINRFFRNNIPTDTLNQFYNDSTHSFSISPTVSYTEPLARNMVLEFNYNHTYNKSTTVNNTYRFTDSLHGYSLFDSLFSNSYKFVSNSDRFGLTWRIQNAKYNLSAGTGIQFTSFNSDNTTKGIVVAHNYVNWTPTVNFQYTFSRTKHLRFFYNGRTGTPSPNQLQPLTTTSDQISYTVGNPDLKPQFTHSVRALYTSFDPVNQRVLFATINASTIVNDIQTKISYNSKGGQTTTYVNLGGTYNVSGYFNYGFPLKTPKSNLNFITNVSYAQSQSLQATDSAAAANDQYTHVYV